MVQNQDLKGFLNFQLPVSITGSKKGISQGFEINQVMIDNLDQIYIKNL